MFSAGRTLKVKRLDAPMEKRGTLIGAAPSGSSVIFDLRRGRIWIADHNFFIEEVVRGAFRQDPIRVFGGRLRLGQPGTRQDEKAQSLQNFAGTMKANHTLDGELP